MNPKRPRWALMIAAELVAIVVAVWYLAVVIDVPIPIVLLAIALAAVFAVGLGYVDRTEF